MQKPQSFSVLFHLREDQSEDKLKEQICEICMTFYLQQAQAILQTLSDEEREAIFRLLEDEQKDDL